MIKCVPVEVQRSGPNDQNFMRTARPAGAAENCLQHCSSKRIPNPSTMLVLYLSARSLFDSVLSTEDGNSVYKIQSPGLMASVVRRAATIFRVVPDHFSAADEAQSRNDEPDRFAHLASIDFNITESSTIRFGGNETQTKDFFKKGEWGWYGQ